MAYQLSNHQQIGVVYEKTDRETDGVLLSRESSTYFDFTSNDENNRERFGVFFNDDNLGLAIADSVDIRINYQELYSSGITNFLFASGENTPILRSEDRNFSQEQLSANIDFGKSINGQVSHEIIYGLSYQQVDANAEMYDRRYAGSSVDAGILDGYPIRDQSFVPESEKLKEKELCQMEHPDFLKMDNLYIISWDWLRYLNYFRQP